VAFANTTKTLALGRLAILAEKVKKSLTTTAASEKIKPVHFAVIHRMIGIPDCI